MLLSGTMLTGCATIMNQTTQSIGISSTPTGAAVAVDNVPNGKTPIIARLTRKDNHFVKIELEGYELFETTLTRRVSGWVWGNVAFGGLIGLAIDAITGGLYKLTLTFPHSLGRWQVACLGRSLSWVEEGVKGGFPLPRR